MREWLTRLPGAMVRHPQYKALSFLIAVTFWFYVQSNELTTVSVRVALDWIVPMEMMTVDPLPPYASIQLGGTRTATRQAREAAEPVLDLNLTTFQLGDHSVELRTFDLSGLPPGVVVEGWAPASVAFRLEEVSTRKVRVKEEQVGEPAAGFAITGIRIEPNVVEVRGPRSRVERLVELSTRPIDVSGFDRLRDVAVRLDLPRSISLVDDIQPRAVVQVEPMLETRTVSDVRVSVWRQAGWHVVQESVAVTLQGPRRALAELSVLDVVAFAHLPDEPQRASYDTPFGPKEGPRLRVLVANAPGVEVVKVEPAVVEVVRE